MDFAALAQRVVTPRRRAVSTAGPHTTVPSAQGDLAVFVAGHGPARALLVHGWEADHGDLRSAAGVLQEEGWTTVAPDLPAYGLSEGGSMTIPEAARALLSVQASSGPFELVVAHSVGTAVALMALKYGLRARRMVLVAPPLNYARTLEATLRQQGVGDAAIAGILGALRARSPDLDDVDAASIASTLEQEGIVVVAKRDKVIPRQDCQAVADAWTGARLIELDAGHVDVLDHPSFLGELRAQALLAAG